MGKKTMYKKGGKKRLKKLKRRKYNVGGMYDNAPPDSFLPVQNIVYDQNAQDSVEQYENQLQHELSKRDWTSAIEHDEMMRKQKNAQLMQFVQGSMKGQNILEGAPEWISTARGNIKSGWNKLWGKTDQVPLSTGPTSSMPALEAPTTTIDTSGMARTLPEISPSDMGSVPAPTTGDWQMGPGQTSPNVLENVELSGATPGATPGMETPVSLDMKTIDQIPTTELPTELPPQPGMTPMQTTEVGKTGMQKFKDFANRPVGKLASAGVMGAGLLGAYLSNKHRDADQTSLNTYEKWGAGLSGFASGASMGKMFGPLGLIAGGAIGAIAARKAQNKLTDRFKRSKRAYLQRRGTAIQNLALAQGAAKEYSGYDTGYGMGGYLGSKYPHGGYHKDSNTVGTKFNPVGHPSKRRSMFEHGGPHDEDYLTSPSQNLFTDQYRFIPPAGSGIVNTLPPSKRLLDNPLIIEEDIDKKRIDARDKALSDVKSRFESYLRRREGGYRYLKGGIARSLPGGAVEFLGRTHEEGGIHLDPKTEVEDKETMDKVNGKDYFFSSHLKLGGTPYSEIHKDILRNGGNQDAINQLAAIQEVQAGRRFYRRGGFKYQDGGSKKNPYINHILSGGTPPYSPDSNWQDALKEIYNADGKMKEHYQIKSDSIRKANMPEITPSPGWPKKQYQNGGENLPVASQDYLTEQGIIPGQQGGFTWNGIQMYGDEQLQKLIADSEGQFGTAFMNRVDPNVLKEAGITSFDQFKDKANILKYQKAWNKLYPDNTILEDSKLGEQTIRTMKKQNIIKLEKKTIDKLPTTTPELELKKTELPEIEYETEPLPKVPWYKKANWGQIGAIGAGLLQLLPAIKASKDKPDYLTGVPQMPKTQLDRVRLTHARDNVRNQFHSMSKSIDDSGLGPAGIAAKMAAYGKQTDAISKIDAKEKMMNVDINTKEEKMNQYTNMFNIKNYLAADEFNRAADAATKDRKLGALQAGVQGFAGVMGDILKYKASREHAQAISGDSGVYERNKQKQLWDRVKNMPRFDGWTYEQFSENYNAQGNQNEAKMGGFKYALGGPPTSYGPPGSISTAHSYQGMEPTVKPPPTVPAVPVNVQGTGTPPPPRIDPTDQTPRTNNTTGFLDYGQKVLQVAGNFPVLGALPDLLNAGISKGRAWATNDPVKKAQFNVDATTNLISAVPGPGDVVGFGATIDAFTGNNARDALAANLQKTTPIKDQQLLAMNRNGGYRKLKKRKKRIYG